MSNNKIHKEKMDAIVKVSPVLRVIRWRVGAVDSSKQRYHAILQYKLDDARMMEAGYGADPAAALDALDAALKKKHGDKK